MKNTNNPLVSVVMPVYNAEKYLCQAVDSILEQTFVDFELIAINDGSTDKSGDILNMYASGDSRVIVVHQENTGIVGALNHGLRLARGKYIARQDSDDISFPTRLEQQVKVLAEQSHIVLVAGSFEVIDEEGEYIYREVLPTDDLDIKRAMLLRNPLGHGSVMFRKEASVEVGGYSDEYGPTEDYLLWSLLANKGDFYALEAATFRWRVNSTGITSTKNDRQLVAMKQQIKQTWKHNPPHVLSRRELRERGERYRATYSKRGIVMKNVILADNAQLGFKLLRQGNFFKGVHQIINVALVGRSGLRAVWHRVHTLRRGTVAAVRKRAKFGRQTAA